MKIQLTPHEILCAAQAGTVRQASAIAHGLKHKYKRNNADSWQAHIEGALTEFAVAKAIGVFWSPAERGASDLSNGDEVRSTTRLNGRLIVHPDDNDEARFFLVVGEYGSYDVKGYIYGCQAKQEKYWTDPGTGRPAYFVPAHDLIQLKEQ